MMMPSLIKYFARLAVMPALLMQQAYAADVVNAAPASPVLGIFKTVLGLCVVLAVMAVVAKLAKRMAGQAGASHSVAKIVGGVSVGSRERVVVIEVGKRWLVVGVAAGSVNAIANLSQDDYTALADLEAADSTAGLKDADVQQGFAAKFKQSLNKALKPD